MNLKKNAQAHYRRKINITTSYTKLVEDFSIEFDIYFKDILSINEKENSIIYAVFPDNNWYVIMVDKICIKNIIEYKIIDFKDITSLKLDLKKITAENQSSINEITIELSNNKTENMRLEEGTYGVILSVLMFLRNHLNSSS